MMKSRGVAVIAAFALIALAIFVRGLLVDDDGGGASDGPEPSPAASGLPVVACTPDLVPVCDALARDGEIAKDPPALDLDGAADPGGKVDGWITWNPAPAIANFTAGQPQVWDDPEVLGSSRSSVLIDGATLAALPAACRTSPTWACLAEASPGLTLGVGDPATAEGIARLAPVARTFTTDDDYTVLDTRALGELLAATTQDDAGSMAAKMAQPGFVSMTVGPKPLLERQAETPQGKQRGLQVIEPSAAAPLTVVLAPRHGRADELDQLTCRELGDRTVQALQRAGVAPCTGAVDDALAGFLFQVQKKVG